MMPKPTEQEKQEALGLLAGHMSEGESHRSISPLDALWASKILYRVVRAQDKRITELKILSEVRGKNCACGDDDACALVKEREELSSREKILQGAIHLVMEYRFDGTEHQWDCPYSTTNSGCSALCSKLREALGSIS